MEKYPRCPNNYHRNKKTKLCEPSTKKKKETVVLRPSPVVASSPTKSKSKSNSFTQKIKRVNQTKQQQQGMMEMISIKSSHHSENKTNPHSSSRKSVRFTLKNKRSTNLKRGKRRTAKKNNTR